MGDLPEVFPLTRLLGWPLTGNQMCPLLLVFLALFLTHQLGQVVQEFPLQR